MGRRLKFNYIRLKSTSEELRSKEEKFENLRKRLISLSASMKEDWQGEDANLFFSKFDFYIENLSSVGSYLNDKALLYESASKLHGNYDIELDEKIKRRTSNE